MKLSELFSFFTILNESIQILPKTWFHLFSITAISMALPSASFLLFTYLYQTLMDATTADSGFKYLAVFLAAEIIFLFIFVAVSRYSSIATIVVSAASYTGNNLTLSDLFSRVKSARKRPPMSPRFRLKSTLGVVLSAALTAAVAIMNLITPITISLLAILWTVLIIFQLKWSVATMTAIVVAVVEEGYEGREAVERGERLVEGQTLKGFMLNLFVNVLVLVGFLAFWLVLGDKGSLNLVIYGLYFVNLVSVVRVCVCVMYTVFYVQCKKLHGEDVDVIGDFQYAKLPTFMAGSDE